MVIYYENRQSSPQEDELNSLADSMIPDHTWMLPDQLSNGSEIRLIPVRSHHYRYISSTFEKVMQTSTSEDDIDLQLLKAENESLDLCLAGLPPDEKNDYLGDTDDAFEQQLRATFYVQMNFARHRRLIQLLTTADHTAPYYLHLGPLPDYICQIPQALGGGKHCASLITRSDELKVVNTTDATLAKALLSDCLGDDSFLPHRKLLYEVVYNDDCTSKTAAVIEYIQQHAEVPELEHAVIQKWHQFHPRFTAGLLGNGVEADNKFLRVIAPDGRRDVTLADVVTGKQHRDVVGRWGWDVLPGTIIEVPSLDIRLDLVAKYLIK